MKTFDLIPTGNRKSFYGKAKVNEVKESDGKTYSYLISYTTKVATYCHEDNKMSVFGWYSAATARHINAFLDLYGFSTCSKKELENWNN